MAQTNDSLRQTLETLRERVDISADEWDAVELIADAIKVIVQEAKTLKAKTQQHIQDASKVVNSVAAAQEPIDPQVVVQALADVVHHTNEAHAAESTRIRFSRWAAHFCDVATKSFEMK